LSSLTSLDLDISAAVAASQHPVASPIRTCIEINPVRILRWHLLCVLLLTLAHLTVTWVHLETGHDHLMGLTQRLQLFTEASIPSFFSAVMLVVAAVVAAVLSRVEGGRRARDGRAWAFITALLLFMAVDEAAMIHEIALNFGQRRQEDGMLYYFWVIPFGGLALVCMAVLLPFWWRLPRHTKWWLAAAAALFLASAIGMELVESALVAEAGEQAAYARWNVIAAITVEECGEMLAVGMAIYALLQHLALTQGTYGTVRFELP
jgi:hypothetical protein